MFVTTNAVKVRLLAFLCPFYGVVNTNKKRENVTINGVKKLPKLNG